MDKTLIRKQWNFNICSKSLNRLLKFLGKNNINILAWDFIAECSCNFNVYLVLGVAATTDNDKEWNNTLRDYLHKHDICYTARKIVQYNLQMVGVPGTFATIYDQLLQKTKIIKIYAGEENTMLIDATPVEKVQQILENL